MFCFKQSHQNYQFFPTIYVLILEHVIQLCTQSSKVKEHVIDCWFMSRIGWNRKINNLSASWQVESTYFDFSCFDNNYWTSFSAIKIVKTRLRNRMEDDFLVNYLIVYIKKEIVERFVIDMIIDDFYFMKEQRAQLK